MRHLALTLCALLLAVGHSVAYAQWDTFGQTNKHRVEANGVVYNGGLFVFNGFSFKIDIETQIERYDFDSDKWQNIAKTSPNGANATAVTHAGAVKVGNEYWLIGGRVGDHPGRVTDRVQIFNLDTYQWRQGPHLPAPFASGGAALVDGKLHVFGGLDGKARCDVGTHYVYNLKQSGQGWQKLAVTMPDKRNHFATIVNNGLIYAIGGQHGHDGQCKGALKSRTQSTAVHAFNPKTNQWQARARLPATLSHTEPSTMSHGGIIYSVGGLGKGNQVLTYTPSKNQWQIRKDLQLPKTLLAPVSVIDGNFLYVVGGGAPSASRPTKTVYRTQLKQIADDDPTPSDNGSDDDDTTAGNGSGSGNDNGNGNGNGSSGDDSQDSDGAIVAASSPYRVNVGGALLIDDDGHRWEADKSAIEYQRAPSRTYSRSTTIAVNANQVNGTVPEALFKSERFASSQKGLEWAFPVKPGDYTVSLYFAEIYSGAFTPGKRVFDIEIEGALQAANVDIAKEVGPRSGTVKTFHVTSDQALNVRLKRKKQNPMLKGIVISAHNGAGDDDNQAGNGGADDNGGSQGNGDGDGNGGNGGNNGNNGNSGNSGGNGNNNNGDGNGNNGGNGNEDNQDAGSGGHNGTDDGSATPAQLRYSTLEVVIADTLAGGSGSATLTIDNIGDKAASLDELSFSGDDASLFDVSLSSGTRVEPGESLAMTIGFRPTDAGQFSTILAIADDTPDKLTLISVEARAGVLDDGITQGTMLPVFRINVGGKDVPAADGVDWQGDVGVKNPGYARSESKVFQTRASVNADRPEIPAYAPAALFSSERWADESPEGLNWTFPVEPGQHEIRLYFAEIYAPAQKAGIRVFDVIVEGQLMIDDLDVYAEAGKRNGLMRSMVVDTDNDLTLSLQHVRQNPAIKAIEIRRCLIDCR